tara:strand:- start:333 stop:503 length:171 start_codon:yes stop_codon:yes gene_type:complete
MTIIEKHFDKKPTRDEMEKFLKKIMKLKGQNKMDVVYDARIDPNYIECRIYDKAMI